MLLPLGCIKIPSGNMVHFSSTVLGLDASQSPDSAAPHLRFGYIRTQGDVIPIGTNDYAPAVRSVMIVKGALTSVDVHDTFETGGATRYNPTNTPAK